MSCLRGPEGPYFEASAEKDVEREFNVFLEGIMTVAERIAFFLTEDEVTHHSTYALHAAASPAYSIVSDTEFRIQLRHLAKLEQILDSRTRARTRE